MYNTRNICPRKTLMHRKNYMFFYMYECMYEYLFICGLIIIWIYSTVCLFFIGSNSGSLYIQCIPMIDNLGTYQVYNFIPLFMFTSYFNKKIYEKQ